MKVLKLAGRFLLLSVWKGTSHSGLLQIYEFHSSAMCSTVLVHSLASTILERKKKKLRKLCDVSVLFVVLLRAT